VTIELDEKGLASLGGGDPAGPVNVRQRRLPPTTPFKAQSIQNVPSYSAPIRGESR
jgi:hypothetical protein